MDVAGVEVVVEARLLLVEVLQDLRELPHHDRYHLLDTTPHHTTPSASTIIACSRARHHATCIHEVALSPDRQPQHHDHDRYHLHPFTRGFRLSPE